MNANGQPFQYRFLMRLEEVQHAHMLSVRLDCLFIEFNLTLVGGMQVFNEVRLCLLLCFLLFLHARQSGGSIPQLCRKGGDGSLLSSYGAL